MEPVPPCTGRSRSVAVRCNKCERFFQACRPLFKHREELRVIYDTNFKAEPMSRRAFIVRSHGLRGSRLNNWLITELEHLNGKGRKGFTYYFGSKKRTADPPKVLHNDTAADMKAVATFTQEHPLCHLVRYASPRGTINPPM